MSAERSWAEKAPNQRGTHLAPVGGGTTLYELMTVHTNALKVALWTSSIGMFAFLVRRLVRRRRANLHVGAVSEDWLAHHRTIADESHW
jgi:hypothetical protein